MPDSRHSLLHLMLTTVFNVFTLYSSLDLSELYATESLISIPWTSSWTSSVRTEKELLCSTPADGEECRGKEYPPAGLCHVCNLLSLPTKKVQSPSSQCRHLCSLHQKPLLMSISSKLHKKCSAGFIFKNYEDDKKIK